MFATARQAESIGDLAAAGMDTLSLELQQPGQIRAARQEVERRTAGAGLDYLVNNAGRGHVVPALDVDMDEARQTFDVNVFAVMRMCQEFAPLLIQGRGTIVQIGSISAVTWVLLACMLVWAVS